MSGVRVKVKSRRPSQHVLLLLAIRRRHHWTQARLAAEIGAARSTIARWERGETDPHPMFMPGLREILARTPGGQPDEPDEPDEPELPPSEQDALDEEGDRANGHDVPKPRK